MYHQKQNDEPITKSEVATTCFNDLDYNTAFVSFKKPKDCMKLSSDGVLGQCFHVDGSSKHFTSIKQRNRLSARSSPISSSWQHCAAFHVWADAEWRLSGSKSQNSLHCSLTEPFPCATRRALQKTTVAKNIILYCSRLSALVGMYRTSRKTKTD